MKYEVLELLQPNDELDDFGRDMVKTRCIANNVLRVVYVQHPIDNRLIDVGYTFDVPTKE